VNKKLFPYFDRKKKAPPAPLPGIRHQPWQEKRKKSGEGDKKEELAAASLP